VDYFRRNSFAYENLSVLSPFIRLFQRRLSASAPGNCPAGPFHSSVLFLEFYRVTFHSLSVTKIISQNMVVLYIVHVMCGWWCLADGDHKWAVSENSKTWHLLVEKWSKIA